MERRGWNKIKGNSANLSLNHKSQYKIMVNSAFRINVFQGLSSEKAWKELPIAAVSHARSRGSQAVRCKL